MNRYVACVYVLLCASAAMPYDAYVVVPVADLVGEPLPSHSNYTSIPYSGSYACCRRLHQILYHERVRVLETRNDQVHIELPTVFYRPCGTTKNLSTFWTLKKYLIPAHNIKGDTNNLPQQPSYRTWHKPGQEQTTTVTLMHPYHDATSGMTFSAGTQFVRVDQSSHTKEISVYLLDPKTLLIGQTKIPAKLCITIDACLSAQQRIDLFIQLMRSWIKGASSKGAIPYVWGGTSILKPINGVAHVHSDNRGQWYDTEPTTQSIKTGCDCSGLIFRAAQICQIPYFFKNSYTATCCLKPVSSERPLAKGDILWVNGHVMIVADLQKHRLIEARSYDHGYGKLQEIPLKKVFKGIHTYQELLNAYTKGIPLQRIDKAGVVRDRFKTFKILSLASAWDCTY